jgi:hypothetical protein
MHGIAKQVPKTLMRMYDGAIVDVFLEMTDGPDIPYESAASPDFGDASPSSEASSTEVVIIASKPTTGIRKQRKRRKNYSNMVVPSPESAFAFAPSTPVMMITPPISMFYEAYPIP